MPEYSIIRDIVIILLVSLPIIFIFKKLNLPSIVGFLLAGVVIGPSGLRLIQSNEQINLMSEIGVILLLFTIGLEISFSQMLKMKKYVFITGSLQLGVTTLIAMIIFYYFKISLLQSVFFGILISISSTSIILNLLSQRNELDAPHGRISIGTSILQDIAVVPMVLLVPILNAESVFSPKEILLQLLIAFGSVGILFTAAKFLMPRIIYQLAKLRMREAFTAGVILLLLGTAFLTHEMGLSFAIGAFAAGLILSESEYSSQITSDVLPFKDTFNSIFFVSVGLLLDLKFVFEMPLIIITSTIGIILLKAITVVVIVLLQKYPTRIAVLSGLMLAQVGEFSFVLAQTGLQSNLFSGEFYNAYLASSIFTIILSPLLVRMAPLIALHSSKFEKAKIPTGDFLNSLKDHVIIAGFGLNGSNLARVLKETGIQYVVVELNPETVKKEKLKGEKIVFGDISKEEILNSVKINRARIIVFAISDPAVTKISLRLSKKLNPDVYTLVRTRYVNEVDPLKNIGADEIIPEEFETAIQIFRKVLEKYHIPLNIIMQQVKFIRDESYRLLRKDETGLTSLANIEEILAQGITEIFYISDDNKFIGKSLSELNLRALTEATIIAIVREGKTISNPSGREIILQNDTLVITGNHFAVDKAISFLSSLSDDSIFN
jgi:CPA2 family monovalent cation:H+ antiporter-2